MKVPSQTKNCTNYTTSSQSLKINSHAIKTLQECETAHTNEISFFFMVRVSVVLVVGVVGVYLKLKVVVTTGALFVLALVLFTS